MTSVFFFILKNEKNAKKITNNNHQIIYLDTLYNNTVLWNSNSNTTIRAMKMNIKTEISLLIVWIISTFLNYKNQNKIIKLMTEIKKTQNNKNGIVSKQQTK